MTEELQKIQTETLPGGFISSDQEIRISCGIFPRCQAWCTFSGSLAAALGSAWWAHSRLVQPGVTLRGRQPRDGFHPDDEMTGAVPGLFVVEACEGGW
jgi:hypothetical protein